MQTNYKNWQVERLLAQLSSEYSQWLAATPLIDTGNNTKGFRYTFFLGPLYDLLSFQQGAGRMAREGQPGTVTVFFNEYRSARRSQQRAG
jgi:hypothetical protein